MKKKMGMVLCIALMLFAVLCLVLFIRFMGIGKTPKPENKAPEAYTWEEYEAMSLEEQDAFFEQFASADEFEAWMASADPQQAAVEIKTWDKPGKTPDAYTYEEYQALSGEEQESFYQWFDSEEAFEEWLEPARPQEVPDPVVDWNKFGKQAGEYTWEEYGALTPEEQDAFFQEFASVDEFEAWMESVRPQENEAPPEEQETFDKAPAEFTWEEYQALDYGEQEAFVRQFASVEAFEAWLENAKPKETEMETPDLKWDKPGKLPSQYTWSEYQALSQEEQDSFYRWFGSVEAFETWMQEKKPAEGADPVKKWDKAGKLPNQYTWSEYQALSPEEQESFYLWFGSMEAFETWMQTVTQ